ncbi:FkbM family methyltransferase [Halobacterium sp. KA-6]|uniref:FkbM family methyltransferase n=1 Tax=Halobacterium sp. KA-6 TaxID=2896368 RepID=UPI001E345FC8|nr:FkbM family methyltransferase [Halobacterium sp. KA-6]MCD2204879.1 FkbM family methyltransferase [Halobacterium sp. KA-6]
MVPQNLSRATSYLPHWKLPVPYRLAPRKILNVYLDREMGFPLNFREPDVQKLFVERISKYHTFFDVGAHIGTYSILGTISENLSIHAFEPHPANLTRLEENISTNKAEEQIKVVPSAVSNVSGEVELQVGRSDSHSIVSSDQDDNKIVVDSTTLDSYSLQAGVYPDLIKVDVEGAGAALIDGAAKVLEQKPDWLVETHSQEEKRAFESAFESRNYTLNKLSEEQWFATSG